MSLTPLDSMRAPAIIFAGQASEWEKQLHNAAASHHAVGRLDNYLTQARSLVSPYALSLIHISEPTRPLYISYAVFCLKKKKKK